MQQVVDVVDLATGGRRMLQLDCDVTYAILVMDNVLYLGAKHFIASLIRRVDEYVRAKGLASRRYGPDVDVVDESHTLDLFNVVAELICVYMLAINPGPLRAARS